MKKLSCQDIRDLWVKFFAEKCERRHKYIPSSSLVPDNPTLLLNSAGMVQFVPIFLGTRPAPEPPRAVTVQKCARVGGKDSDLENIGRTTRHHSFFEMLGNFSFGDYFKTEVIPWAWIFVTQELGLDPNKLYVSVFAGDDTNAFDKEAYDIWDKLLANNFPDAGERSKRIWKLTRKDNFWGPPGKTGPCGPCSEIYYDLGDHILEHDDRYIEIWNLVFMEFQKDEEANYSGLAKKNIDTGAGLERIAMIVQGVNNSFETNELFAILTKLSEELSSDTGRKIAYKLNSQEDLYLKIITDHLRCSSFLIADGVRPSNVGRGYVLRMIIRRAARFVYLLRSTADAFLYKIVPELVLRYREAYPELSKNEAEIVNVMKKEEEQFMKTIANGLAVLEKTKSNPEKILKGDFVFDLYSTYGLPLELTAEIAQEYGKEIDYDGYQAAKAKHSEVSNTGAFDTSVESNSLIADILREHGSTKFLGYDQESSKAKVLGIIPDRDGLSKIILDQTPFYAESGGQLADQGIISIDGLEYKVSNVKNIEGIFLHYAQLSGSLSAGTEVTATIDTKRRNLTRKHHTACHLLQAALRNTLGDQVRQMGSQVGPEYTRFDFNLDRGMTKEEISQVEKQINNWISHKLPVQTKLMSLDQATKAGALSFFEEKYEDEVRVLSIGDASETASVELCGGTHVSNIEEIEEIIIASEGSVASGIRRIKLLASQLAHEYKAQELEKARLQAQEEEAREKAQAEAKALKQALTKTTLAYIDEFITKVQIQNGVKILILNLDEKLSGEGFDADIVKTLIEALASKLDADGSSSFILLAKILGDKVMFMSKASDALVKDPNSIYNAASAVKTAAQICGGGGGGKPNFAQAGGKDIRKIQEALSAIIKSVSKSNSSAKSS